MDVRLGDAVNTEYITCIIYFILDNIALSAILRKIAMQS